MFALAVALVAAPLVLAVYAYVGYPAIVWTLTRARRNNVSPTKSATWPMVTITVPVYNSVSSIRATLEGLIKLDYPRDKIQLLVLSDASTDGTDAIVREFAPR